MDVLDLHWYPEARSGTNPDAGTRITENNNTTGRRRRARPGAALALGSHIH